MAGPITDPQPTPDKVLIVFSCRTCGLRSSYHIDRRQVKRLVDGGVVAAIVGCLNNCGGTARTPTLPRLLRAGRRGLIPTRP